MFRTTYSARITGPLHYTTSSGKQADVPLGPCLIEQLDGQRVDIVWGQAARSPPSWHSRNSRPQKNAETSSCSIRRRSTVRLRSGAPAILNPTQEVLL
jgi:hypothetical protein